MNTTNQTIPTAFSPETSFAIALNEADTQHERVTETLIPFHMMLPSEAEFASRGIPESALHD